MIPGPNWGRRYGTHHRRLCARPGCGSPAAATLRFQPTQREAWLVDLDDTSPRTEGDLCARHAAALVLPRGWELHDQRAEPTEQTPPPPPRQPKSKRAPRKRALEAVPSPQLFEPPTPEPEPEPEPVVEADLHADLDVDVDVDVEVEVDVEPDLDTGTPLAAINKEPDAVGEELKDVLDVHTPLLRRAFQNVWPLGGGSPTDVSGDEGDEGGERAEDDEPDPQPEEG